MNIQIPAMPSHIQVLVGVLLMLAGVSFVYKGWQATVNGKLTYWDGFLPFTIISPFILHLPSGKRSLVKTTEGLWVHLLMGPVFLLTAVFCLSAGGDFVGLPGTQTVNTIIAGGKAGRPVAIIFDKRYGYKFPCLSRSGEQLAKIFGKEIDLKSEDRMVQQPTGSYADAQAAAS